MLILIAVVLFVILAFVHGIHIGLKSEGASDWVLNLISLVKILIIYVALRIAQNL
jgi:hypothetical protein